MNSFVFLYLCSNRNITERGQNDISNTQIHDRYTFRIGTGTSIKSGGIKVVLRAQTHLVKWCGHATVFFMWVDNAYLPSSPMGHKASTICCHLPLSFAMYWAWPIENPTSSSADVIVLLHYVLGVPCRATLRRLLGAIFKTYPEPSHLSLLCISCVRSVVRSQQPYTVTIQPWHTTWFYWQYYSGNIENKLRFSFPYFIFSIWIMGLSLLYFLCLWLMLLSSSIMFLVFPVGQL
jgi:hypothetical protein